MVLKCTNLELQKELLVSELKLRNKVLRHFKVDPKLQIESMWGFYNKDISVSIANNGLFIGQWRESAMKLFK